MSAVEVRMATTGDAAAIARVHIESSRDAYAPLARAWPTLDLAERTRVWARNLAESEADARCFELVATIDDEVVGFVGAGPARRDDVDG